MSSRHSRRFAHPSSSSAVSSPPDISPQHGGHVVRGELDDGITAPIPSKLAKSICNCGQRLVELNKGSKGFFSAHGSTIANGRGFATGRTETFPCPRPPQSRRIASAAERLRLDQQRVVGGAACADLLAADQGEDGDGERGDAVEVDVEHRVGRRGRADGRGGRRRSCGRGRRPRRLAAEQVRGLVFAQHVVDEVGGEGDLPAGLALARGAGARRGRR